MTVLRCVHVMCVVCCVCGLDLVLVEPGLGSPVDFSPAASWTHTRVPMPEYDSIVKLMSQQQGLDYAVNELSVHLDKHHKEDVDLVVVSASRGAGCVLEAIRRGIWKGYSVFLSPIINGGDGMEEDNYANMIEILAENQIKFLVAVGSSTDEQLLIYEPLMDALASRLLLLPSEISYVFAGNHDWHRNPSNWQELLVHINHAFSDVKKKKHEL